MGKPVKPVVRTLLSGWDRPDHKGEIPDKEVLKECLAECRAYTKDVLKLEFNQKTQIMPISQGVDYPGWHFYLTDTGKVIRKLRTSGKRRFKRRLQSFRRKYATGDIGFDDIKRSLVSYQGHLKHGHIWKLRKKVYGSFVLSRAEKDNKDTCPIDEQRSVQGGDD